VRAVVAMNKTETGYEVEKWEPLGWDSATKTVCGGREQTKQDTF